jgi:GxxExxY protein
VRELTFEIINAAITVHKELGPGLLENIYQRCMVLELEDRGLKVASEFECPIHYKGHRLSEVDLRLDLLVERTIIVELKSIQHIEAIHKKQLLSYLRLMKLDLGLLINFNVELLRDGVCRVANSPTG